MLRKNSHKITWVVIDIDDDVLLVGVNENKYRTPRAANIHVTPPSLFGIDRRMA